VLSLVKVLHLARRHRRNVATTPDTLLHPAVITHLLIKESLLPERHSLVIPNRTRREEGVVKRRVMKVARETEETG
jgi:hypothetical protein